ncbi:MAG: hypothetical protein AAB225_09330 [Acidobacteriota bacterium]
MNWKIAYVLAACAATLAAQTAEQPVVLVIELENDVLYRGNVSDVNLLAKDPKPTTSANQAFLESVAIADVRAINGKPVKGLRSYRVRALPFRVNPTPGQPIADFDGGGLFMSMWHILLSDGTYVGSIYAQGAPPSPDSVIVGGTGAFFGVTGVVGSMEITPQRGASMSEDPANRRIHGGGRSRTTFYLYPKSRPEVQVTPSGPAVFHADDFSLVTAAKPARSGEWLILSAAGLGPTSPSIDPGKPFPPYVEGKVHLVTSPLEVTVGGNAAELRNAIGWPGQANVYRVDFRVPEGTAAGVANLGLSVAWINGPEVKIPVR